MTAWIDWRTEPIMDVPEIIMRKRESDGKIVLTCNDVNCKWEEVADNPDQIEAHQDWHENGMPQ